MADCAADVIKTFLAELLGYKPEACFGGLYYDAEYL
jgi:hypothetical protein